METATLNLEHGKLLSLKAAPAWEIVCLDGALMLSGPSPVGDVELRAGQRYLVPTGELLLLEAWGDTRLTLQAPAAKPGWLHSLFHSFAHVFCSRRPGFRP